MATTAGCAPGDGRSTSASEAKSSRSQALSSQNSLTTNSLLENGFWENGFWENGFWENGFWENGFWENGFWENGFWENGFWENGFWENGLWENGFWENGFAAESLRSSRYPRELLQYIYACGMPATLYDTALDPNGGLLACGLGGKCDPGYACSNSNRCVVPLKGSIGVGINENGTSWWESGKCDESCQRWVSACVLARTNAYGVKVGISMRAPPDAPQKIKDALATTQAEVDEFCLPEGAFYGNIFATTPANPVPPPTCIPGGECTQFSGPTDGPIASTPSFNACAGPGSNIPQMTKRFCSSTGDQSVINVPGLCVSNQTGVCEGRDNDPQSLTFGSFYNCAVGSKRTDTRYKEVITVYLRAPVATCGNNVCEPPLDFAGCPGSGGEDATSCPDDCHDSTWTKQFGSLGQGVDLNSAQWQFAELGMSAVAPEDNSILVVGNSSDDLAPDGAPDGVTLPVSQGKGVVLKYTADGHYAWGLRAQPNQPASFDHWVNGVAVAPNGGDINIVGYAIEDVPGGGINAIWMNTYNSAGALLAASSPIFATRVWPIEPAPCPDCVPTLPARKLLTTKLLAVDLHGDVLLTGIFSGETVFGTADVFDGDGIFLAKVSPLHGVRWVQRLAGDIASGFPLSLVVDRADDIILVTGGAGGNLQKRSSLDGSVMWTRSAGSNAAYSVAAVDPSGNVYASGYFGASQDFGGGEITSTVGLPPFLAKYSGDNTFQWVSYANTVCPPGPTPCGGSMSDSEVNRPRVEGASISFDPAGNVILGSFGNPAGAGVDFGFGTFPTYHSNNIFLAAYSPDLGSCPVNRGSCGLKWARQIPTVVKSGLLGMAVDSNTRVVVSGRYSGSMQVDNRLLVTQAPGQPDTVDAFLASFAAPNTSDTAAPDIGAATDLTGAPVLTMPANIITRATSAEGAEVFFMPPTAQDAGHAGTSIACSPPPNTTFPIGTTTVTCTASDPLGNQSSASFTVTVADNGSPFFTQVPGPITVEATGPSGAIATYALPNAIDQIDGSRPVTCSPQSGSTFAVGSNTVTCTSSDTHGNTSSARITVNVVDTTAPILTLPGTITATATSANGAVVTYTTSATDIVDGAITPVCTPRSGSIFDLGTTTVLCTATDSHGNPAIGTFQVKVEYGWSGILQPINADGSSVFKLGSTVPVKFQLVGASGGVTNAMATLTLAKVTSSVVGTEVEAVSTSAATTGNAFRYEGGQYIFNLSTKNLSKGTWQLSIDLHDGASRTVLISLR